MRRFTWTHLSSPSVMVGDWSSQSLESCEGEPLGATCDNLSPDTDHLRYGTCEEAFDEIVAIGERPERRCWTEPSLAYSLIMLAAATPTLGLLSWYFGQVFASADGQPVESAMIAAVSSSHLPVESQLTTGLHGSCGSTGSCLLPAWACIVSCRP